MDVVLAAFDGASVAKPYQAEFGGAVVALAKVAVNTGVGRSHNDPTISLFAEMRPSCPGGQEGASQVDLHELWFDDISGNQFHKK